MAIVTELPGQKIIDGFKGVLDFYYYMGIPCVRSWPRSPGKSRNANVEAQWERFAYASQTWDELSPFVKAAYKRLADSCGLHAKDWFTRGYLSGIYKYPEP